MLSKYDKDGPFVDPVVRCCDCKELILRSVINTNGCCPGCGNRRMRNVLSMSEKEMEVLKANEIDPEFIALFEGVDVERLAAT